MAARPNRRHCNSHRHHNPPGVVDPRVVDPPLARRRGWLDAAVPPALRRSNFLPCCVRPMGSRHQHGPTVAGTAHKPSVKRAEPPIGEHSLALQRGNRAWPQRPALRRTEKDGGAPHHLCPIDIIASPTDGDARNSFLLDKRVAFIFSPPSVDRIDFVSPAANAPGDGSRPRVRDDRCWPGPAALPGGIDKAADRSDALGKGDCGVTWCGVGPER